MHYAGQLTKKNHSSSMTESKKGRCIGGHRDLRPVAQVTLYHVSGDVYYSRLPPPQYLRSRDCRKMVVLENGGKGSHITKKTHIRGLKSAAVLGEAVNGGAVLRGELYIDTIHYKLGSKLAPNCCLQHFTGWLVQ